MEYNEFSWERQRSLGTGAALSASDVEAMTRLMMELRELTLSRQSFAAASEFLKRLGHDTDSSVLVLPEALAN